MSLLPPPSARPVRTVRRLPAASKPRGVEALEDRLCLAAVTFLPAVQYAAGDAPTQVAVGDFNRDGRPDLAVAGGGATSAAADGSVRVLLGRGDGTFKEPAAKFAAGPNISSIVARDFNRDGRLDVAVSNETAEGQVRVLLGNGDGTLRAARAFFAGGDTREVAAADFNRDGRLDLVSANASPWAPPGSDQPSTFGGAVLLGNGDGSFRAALKIRTDMALHFVRTGDFNRDGRADAAFAGPTPPSPEAVVQPPTTRAFVAFNTLTNGLLDFKVMPHRQFKGEAAGVAAGDLNGDGRPDLVVAVNHGDSFDTDPSIASVAVLLGGGETGLLLPTVRPVDLQLSDVALGDFDADGRQDVAVAATDPRVLAPFPVGVVAVLRNLGGGRLADPTQSPRFAHRTAQLAVGSFNRDKLPDVAVAQPDIDKVSVLINNTKAIFATGVNITATAGVAFRKTVARFTVTGGRPPAGELRASVNWGDGTAATAGTIVANSDGSYAVVAGHKYARAGTYRITTTIRWPAAEASRTVTSTARVTAPAPAVALSRDDDEN